MRQPRMGDTVYAVGGPAWPGGTDTATAVVTRVGDERPGGGWEVDMVVHPAGRPSTTAAGMLYPTEEAARATLQRSRDVAAYWPEEATDAAL